MFVQKAWEFAKSPMSQLPMFLFIFWMTGSSLSIYTIMFTVQFATAPVKAIFNVMESFKQFETKGLSLVLPKLLFIACNCVTIGLAAYKFGNMGILPILPTDWAGLFTERHAIEQNQVIYV